MEKYKLKQCAWCRRVKNIDTGIWDETVDIIMNISHTVCPECKKKLWESYNKTNEKVDIF